MASTTDDSIQFLGTGGARFVMIRQQRSTGGAVYSVGGVRLLVDPGPGCLLRCLTGQPKVEPTSLDGIVLTHGHLDHSGDVNVMIEAMTQGGRNPKGLLLAPEEALEGDPVVLRYLRAYLGHIAALAEGRRFELAHGVSLTSPVRHRHGGETYGFILESPGVRVGHVADTQWFPDLGAHYAGCDLLVLHVVFDRLGEEYRPHILHLDADDAIRILRGAAPRRAVITHFGTPMLRAGPAAVAARIAEATAIEVVAAEDGMVLDVGERD